MTHDVSISEAANGYIIAVPYYLYKSHKPFIAATHADLIKNLEGIFTDIEKHDQKT